MYQLNTVDLSNVLEEAYQSAVDQGGSAHREAAHEQTLCRVGNHEMPDLRAVGP